MQRSLIAKICHEANAAYCRSIGDFSQPTWAEAPGWQKISALTGVQKIADAEITRPEQSHESWMEQKHAEGWVYGEVKDPETKTHPCMVAFDELPEDQQMKDVIFFTVARALLGTQKR